MGIYIANIIITIMIIMITEKRDMVYQVTTKENVKVPIYAILTILFIWTYIYAGRGLNVGSDTSGYYGFYQLLTKSNITLNSSKNFNPKTPTVVNLGSCGVIAIVTS